MGFFGCIHNDDIKVENESERKIKTIQRIENDLSTTNYVENIDEIIREIENNSDFNIGCSYWAEMYSDIVDVDKVSYFMFINTHEYKILSAKRDEWINNIKNKVNSKKNVRRSERLRKKFN
jgi:hypothetical protein